MNKIIIYCIVGVLVLGAGIAFFFWLVTPTPPTTSNSQTTTTTGGSSATQGNTGNTNTGNNTGVSVTPGSSAASTSLTVAATTGSSIVVNDFRKDPQTVSTSDIPNHYFIAGGIDAYINNAPYSIYYVTTDQSFNIEILAEPIGNNRKLAEQLLMQKLGISSLAMCRLLYFVTVPKDVNADDAAKGNLGFSFCPGATQL